MAVYEETFNAWMRELIEDVIQGDYGYEEGESTVYPGQWRPLYDVGLTPAAAFRRALDAFTETCAESHRAHAENWARIQGEDTALRSVR